MRFYRAAGGGTSRTRNGSPHARGEDQGLAAALVGALTATTLSVTIAPSASADVHAAALSSPGGRITRTEVLARAADWYDHRHDPDMTYSTTSKTWDGGRYPFHAIPFGGWENSAKTRFWYHSFGSTPLDKVTGASFSDSTVTARTARWCPARHWASRPRRRRR